MPRNPDEEPHPGRHDEFVYYDAAREHSRLYQLCCCPSYGKITSKRIIYSAPNPIDLGIPCIPDAVTGCWCKKIETMDYRLIDDVSVEQVRAGRKQREELGLTLVMCTAVVHGLHHGCGHRQGTLPRFIRP